MPVTPKTQNPTIQTGNTALTVICVDGVTGARIPADIFVNGIRSASPVSVTFHVFGPVTVYVIEAKCSGYTTYRQTYSQTRVVYSDTITLPMTPVANAASPVSVFCSPELSNVKITLSRGEVSYGALSQNGLANIGGVLPGQYTLTAVYAGYDTYTQTVVPSGSPIQIVLVKSVDSGASDSKEAVPASVAAPVASPVTAPTNAETVEAIVQSLSLAKDPLEAIPENTVGDTYFTGAQARVFIGGMFIDELQAIQWNNQSNAIPVYSYCSRFADAFATGKSLVQGQIDINYITDGYLYTVLDEYRKSKSAEAVSTDDVQAKQILALQRAKKTFATPASEELRRLYLNANPSANKNDPALAIANTVQTNDQISKGIDRKVAELVKNPAAVRKAGKPASLQDPIRNATYEDMVFDIVIEIGTGTHKSTRRLEKCRLTTNISLISNTGVTLAESYGFIGRRAQ